MRFKTLIKIIRAHRIKIGVSFSGWGVVVSITSIIRLLMFLILVGIRDFFVSWEIELSVWCGI